MKKRWKIVLTLALLLTVAGQVSATWYTSTITLPRSGWWYTVERSATSDIQATRVDAPQYDVVANIFKKDSTPLSSNKTHPKGQYSVNTYVTNLKGADMKAGFRSSAVNIFTNRVNLGWSP